ncbi:MAG: AMP-binding protein [Natrialbaceae archaeon]|nr:AMP-binding protein [Natrialbaceae archaeon]
MTYHELHRQAEPGREHLEAAGVGTGDTVGLYMPMVPEVVSILFGCFKVGAIAVPIFSGFGVDAVATRIEDAECSVLFTGDGFLPPRRPRPPQGRRPTRPSSEAGHVEHTIVYDRLGRE